MPCGIEKISFYPGTLSLDFRKLARLRKESDLAVIDELMIRERSVIPLWEDPVTMAVNATVPLLSESDREKIDLVIVATESGVDAEKPISSWVHRFLRLSPNCRNFEIKCACYGSTAALRMAIAHVASHPDKEKKALVVTTDQSTQGLGGAHEYVLGCGSVAMLVSSKPDFLSLDPAKYGIYSQEVADIFRPLPWVEAGNAETSLFSYLESLGECFEDYARRAGDVRLDRDFDHFVFHVPFPGLSYRAHHFLFKNYSDIGRQAAQDQFDAKTKDSLKLSERIGGVYSGGVYLALLSLMATNDRIAPGKKVGVFAYGSGSCAEFFSATVGDGAKKAVANGDPLAELNDRLEIGIEPYELLEKTRFESMQAKTVEIDLGMLGSEFFQTRYVRRNRLVLRKVQDYYRHYAWSEECRAGR
ncbi:MAG TPA: hydroxymethylglutaryl-CoA synthase [bacterium]|nr:hydroxymethylglutaryl-CoA synthase [bacterium]